MGQLPEGTVTLIEDAAQARTAPVPDDVPLAFITQTTLSVDDTAGIVAVLRARFPEMHAPAKEDICYATTNRQAAVKVIAPRAELMVVVGAPNSSNSLRLVEVAERAGCPRALMVQRGRDLDPGLAAGLSTIGITAGASAPEVLVEEVLARLRERFDLSIEEVVVAEERITFKLPAALQPAPA
ncbi:MAG TPA: 4-hydroxy-3-methylbut-2-enyl diphosphate reductase, partial [Geminicoccaceae bacterium]